MFRFFRKHGWILIVVIILTILSFVIFMGNAGTRGGRGGGGGGSADLGTLYGRPVTPSDYEQAQNDFELSFFLQNHEWPDRTSVSELDMAKQTYLNLLYAAKAKALGIAVSSEAAANAAATILSNPNLNRALGNRSGKPISMDEFVKGVLQSHRPEPLTAEDFAHFIRSQMTREQLQMTMGLSGAFVTPQEASAAYDRQHQNMSTEAMLFSASNYLGKVVATPAEVAQFYTNYMADYRYPDRVQVNYVYFDLSNYLAQAKAEWAKTNFEEMVTNVYKHQMDSDPSVFGTAKTPAAAMQFVRDSLVKQRATVDVEQTAQEFVSTLFSMTPVQLDNFNTVAKQKHLAVHVSEPFAEEGSDEFADAPDLVKKAFTDLTAESPFSGAIPGRDGMYVIGLVTNLPSSVPAFADIQARVTKDFELQQAIIMAREAGTNFWLSAAVQAAAGKSLAQIASSKGLSAVTVAPFSLSSQDIPEIGEHVEPQTYKAVAFHTLPGHLSPLLDSHDGNFLVYVKSVSAPDTVAKAAELPQFTAQMRRERENEAFGIWVNTEASRELANVPALKKALSANR